MRNWSTPTAKLWTRPLAQCHLDFRNSAWGQGFERFRGSFVAEERRAEARRQGRSHGPTRVTGKLSGIGPLACALILCLATLAFAQDVHLLPVRKNIYMLTGA